MTYAIILLMVTNLKKLYIFFGTFLSVLLIASVASFVIEFLIFQIEINYSIFRDFNFWNDYYHFYSNLYSIYSLISRIQFLIFWLMVVICIFYVIKGIIKLIAARLKKKEVKVSENAKIIIFKGVVGIFLIFLLSYLKSQTFLLFFGFDFFWGYGPGPLF